MSSLIVLSEINLMETNLLSWGTIIGALSRIIDYEKMLSKTDTYFDRLRMVNEALGPHWVFRLADVVGIDVIKENRLSWYKFYIEDTDGLHCPLDPGAPETKMYLGRMYSDMDMAFYAGMGFDGYRLALQTKRVVNLDTKELFFDKRYTLKPSEDLYTKLKSYDQRHFIPKEDYYFAYGSALSVLFEQIKKHSGKETALEQVVAGCLILLCGGHRGCKKHITMEEEFLAQMESLIIFNHAKNVMLGNTSLHASSSKIIHAVN